MKLDETNKARICELIESGCLEYDREDVIQAVRLVLGIESVPSEVVDQLFDELTARREKAAP